MSSATSDLDAGGVVSVVVGDARVEALARIVVAVTRRVVVIISAIAGVVVVVVIGWVGVVGVGAGEVVHILKGVPF